MKNKTIICHNCIHKNVKDAHFCENCFTPLDSYATTAPAERVWAEIDSLSKQTRPMTKRALVGVWFFNVTPILGFIICLVALCLRPDEDTAAITILFFFGSLYSSIILYKAHMNFKNKASIFEQHTPPQNNDV